MKLNTCRTFVAAALLTAGLNAHATLSAEELRHQAGVIDYALNQSSVSELIEMETREQARQWLVKAETNRQQGNLKTAQAQLLEAGRLLYPMDNKTAMGLEKRQRWLSDIEQVVAALIPAARDIAQQKEVMVITLDAAEYLHQSGQEALAANDLDRAERYLQDAYRTLQQEIIKLRSGDMVVIQQPDAATQDGWLDAERRYTDWRFFADWMVKMAAAMGTDPQTIDRGSVLADALYQQALTHAAEANWLKASHTLDGAYQVMEEHWRKAGVDI